MLTIISVSVDSPLYVYPHSKTVLNRAIERDSEFLASNFVMDYSLLVGVDETKKELVIGIIGTYSHTSSSSVFCAPISQTSGSLVDGKLLFSMLYCRLHSHFYLGQKAWDIDKINRR